MTSLKPSDDAEKKLSGYRYGREEMLAMFAPALPIPGDLRDMTIFCMRDLLPLAFLPVTEEEQTALSRCVNSDLALRANQRAPQLPQGARTASGEQKRARGRGRAGNSVGHSKANDGRSEAGDSVSSGDWRKEKGQEKTGAGGPAQGSTMTKAPCDISESSEESSELNAGEEIQAVQCSDGLSYPAATSLSENVNYKTAIVVNPINHVVHNNTNSEQTMDRHKHDPSVALSNGDISRNHFDPRLSKRVPSSDTKHCSGDAQRLSVNTANCRMLDTSALSSHGEGFRSNLKSDNVTWSNSSNWSKAAMVSGDAQQSGFLPAPPATETWFYKDPNGQIQGPFMSRDMEQWFLLGYFPMKLLIRPSRSEEFVFLGDLIKAYGRVPFLSRTDEKGVPISRDQSVLPDQNHPPFNPLFHQPFIPPAKTFNVPSFLSETVAPPPLLHNQRLETRLSSAASVASRDSGWPFNSTAAQIEANALVTMDRERIEDDLKKRIERQVKERLMLEMEREQLRMEQVKIEEERRLMIEHHQLLEDEKKRQEERRKMEDERKHLEEERRKLEELHWKAEEERRLQEHFRVERQREEDEKRMIEDERKELERERHHLELLHRKAEGDRRAMQQEMQDDMIYKSDEDDDDEEELFAESIVREETNEKKRFGAGIWSTWKEDGDGRHFEDESVRVKPCDDGRGEFRENGAESGFRKSDREEQMTDALDYWVEEENCVDAGRGGGGGLSLKNANETKKKLVAWNSSSKNEAEKQCTPTSPAVKCPWATSALPVVSQPSAAAAAEVLDVRQTKKDEVPAPLTRSSYSQAQKQRLDAIQQQKKQMSFNWNEQKTDASAQAKVKSFLEIQEEQAKQEKEEKRRQQQKQQQQQQQQIGKVPIKMKPQKASPTASQMPPPRLKAAAAATKANAPVMSSASSLLGTPCSVPGLMCVPAVPTIPAQQWMKPPPMTPAAEMNEFMVWCHRALPATNASIDVQTLIDFLLDVDSPYELYDYVRLYLGESKQSTDFAREFIEKRKRLQMRMNRAALGYHLTPVYPTFTFGYQTGVFYQQQPYSGNVTTMQPDKVKGQKMLM